MLSEAFVGGFERAFGTPAGTVVPGSVACERTWGHGAAVLTTGLAHEGAAPPPPVPGVPPAALPPLDGACLKVMKCATTG